MARLHYTDVIGTLGSGGLTNVATTHTFTSLTYVNGTAVPTLAAGESFLLSILDASGNVLEVVNVTAYNSGTKVATIARAQEGTTAIAHAGSLNVANSVYPSDLGFGTLYCQYAPAVAVLKSTTSTSSADIDATNLVLPTFVGPPSGLVLVGLSAYAAMVGSAALRWGLRAGGSDVTGSYMEVMGAAATLFVASRIIIPVTPGTSYTWKWAWKVTGGTGYLATGDAAAGSGPALMTVTAVL